MYDFASGVALAAGLAAMLGALLLARRHFRHKDRRERGLAAAGSAPLRVALGRLLPAAGGRMGSGERRKPTLLPIVVVLAGGLATSAGGFLLSGEYYRQKYFRDHFMKDTTEHAKAFGENLVRELEALRAIRGLYAASQEVERDEFYQFMQTGLSSGAGIEAHGWIPRVPSDERGTYAQAARDDGYPSYEIAEWDAEGRAVPAAPRDVYFPVLFLEPEKGYEHVLGLDLGSDPRFLEALAGARDSGRPMATPPVSLSGGAAREILLFAPIYLNGRPVDSLSQRRENLHGFAFGILRIDVLMNVAITGSAFAGKIAQPRFEAFLIDWGAGPGQQLLFASDGGTSNRAPREELWRRLSDPGVFSSAFDVGGRTWTLYFKPLGTFAIGHRGVVPWGIALVGLLLTLVLLQYLVSARHRTREVEELITRRTEEVVAANQALQKEMAERSRAEAALRKEEKRFRAVVNNSPAAIFMKDLAGRFILVNDHFRRWYCPSGTDPLGKTSFDIYPNAFADRYVTQDNEVLERQQAISRELKVPFADGKEHLVLVTKFPILDDAGQPLGVGTINTDVTKQREVESQLRQAQKMDAIGQLAGGIAHDLNNILVPILGLTKITMDQLPANTRGRSNLEKVLEATYRAKNLVSQILAFSRADQQERKPVSLAAVVGEVLDLLRASLPATIQIRQDIDPDGGMVLADTTQIHQVLMNLASNAEHAMGKGGGTLTVSLGETEVDAARAKRETDVKPGRYCRIRVSDTGCGMDAAMLERIFDPFFTTKPVGQGTGMGLAVVHGIISQHEGTIRVSSGPDGTTFEIYLPVWTGEAAGAGRAGAESAVEAARDVRRASA